MTFAVTSHERRHPDPEGNTFCVNVILYRSSVICKSTVFWQGTVLVRMVNDFGFSANRFPFIESTDSELSDCHNQSNATMKTMAPTQQQ